MYDVQPQPDGSLLLVKIQRPEPKRKLTREECRKAITENPLNISMTWEELRQITRKP